MSVVKNNIIIPFSEWFLHFEDLRLDNDLIVNELKNLTYDSCENNLNIQNIIKSYISKNTNIFSTLTNGNLIKQGFKDIIKEGIKDVGIYQDFDIQSNWATLVKNKGFSEIHYHSNYWLSAVYYPSGTLEDNIKIDFFRPQILPWDVNNKDTDSIYLNNFCRVNVKKGDLIVFPSYLRHRISYYFGDSDRYSIAMNIHPIGKIGRKDSIVTF